jgi:hypothetical protein
MNQFLLPCDWACLCVMCCQVLVMKALVGLCTVLYKSFPTSIQQDRAALAALQGQADPQQQQQQQQQQGGDAVDQERSAAVQFRLGQKLLLERSTKQLLQRLQQLAAQQ